MAKQAVLLLAHGTPETVEQIPEYLRNVISGRPLPQQVVEEIQHRYSLIGRSPLTEITLEQARLVEAELAAARPARSASTSACATGVPTSPTWSARCAPTASKKQRSSAWRRRTRAPAWASTAAPSKPRPAGLRIDFTAGWAQHPLLAEAFAERLRPACAKLSAETGAPVPVLFTAHSVPTRTVQPPADADRPAASLARRRRRPLRRRGPAHRRLWSPRASPRFRAGGFAFQSQGASGGPWIGPTVEETLDSIAAEGVKTLLLQPIGFLCDHVEILYDVDILFRDYAAKRGIRLERPESLNASLTLAKAVADLARQGLARLAG